MEMRERKRAAIRAAAAIITLMLLSLFLITHTGNRANAAVAKPAGVTGNPYVIQWGDNQNGNCVAKNANSVFYNNTYSVFSGSCWSAWPGGGGYEVIYEDLLDGSGLYWSTDGYCMGWNQSEYKIVLQTCNGASYQLWAGTGTSPDLIWNKWYDTNYHNECPIPGGYTQSVITADSSGQDLFLACPEDHQEHQYTTNQKWFWSSWF